MTALNSKYKGFTLVELLVVIAVISVISAIAVPTYLSYIKRSKAIVILASVKDALKQLANDTDKWPGNKTPYICPMNQTPSSDGAEYSDLTANNIGLFNNNGTAFSNWDGPYLPVSYLDTATGKFLDPWGKAYFMDYDYDVNGRWQVVVGSSGPNKSAINVYDSDNIYVVVGQ